MQYYIMLDDAVFFSIKTFIFYLQSAIWDTHSNFACHRQTVLTLITGTLVQVHTTVNFIIVCHSLLCDNFFATSYFQPKLTLRVSAFFMQSETKFRLDLSENATLSNRPPCKKCHLLHHHVCIPIISLSLSHSLSLSLLDAQLA